MPRQKSCSCPKGGIKTLPLPISHEQSPGDVWLKKLLAEAMLDNAMLRDVAARKW